MSLPEEIKRRPGIGTMRGAWDESGKKSPGKKHVDIPPPRLTEEQERQAWRTRAQEEILLSLIENDPGSDEAFGIRDYTEIIMNTWLGIAQRRLVGNLWDLTEQEGKGDWTVSRPSAAEIAKTTKEKAGTAEKQLLKVAAMNLITAQRREGIETRYSISDRFLACGLLLQFASDVWKKQLKAGTIQRKLDMEKR